MRPIIVMGVSGCGKSHIGAALAQQLQMPFHDGDDHHPRANIEKMRAGQPLTDQDRAGWLQTLSALLRQKGAVVLACSALKRRYRDQLRQGAPDAVFVHLDASFEVLAQRMEQRKGHFFKGTDMLRSQFETLEPPGPDEDAVRVDIDQSPEAVVNDCLTALRDLVAVDQNDAR